VKRIITYTGVTNQQVDSAASLGDLRQITILANNVTTVSVAFDSGGSPSFTLPALTAVDIGETDISKLYCTAPGTATIYIIAD